MVERFYLAGAYDEPELRLEGSEAHHLAHVLRLGPGAEVTLFNGEGREAVAEVTLVTKREVRLRRRRVVEVPDAAAVTLTLAVAPPKGDRFRWLVEKATELGVARFVPLLTRRTVVDPREGKLDKLRQTVIAACKQCGRSRLMEIREATPMADLLAGSSGPEYRVMLHPGAASLRTTPRTRSGPARVTLLIGPEGGFTEDEVAGAASGGGQVACLGPTILRTETAAIAAASVVMFGGEGTAPSKTEKADAAANP